MIPQSRIPPPVVAGLFSNRLPGRPMPEWSFSWILAVLPVFAAGPTEDITKPIGAGLRLLASFASAGLAHAINIIDGLNGLAAAVCLMAFMAFGYVGFQVHDTEILLLAGVGFGAMLGFNIWNYPSGQIFCGDGGAYFLGVYLAVLSTLLVVRNPEVSAWFPLLLVLYPVWETLFSAYRRKILRGQAMMHPDRLHLHTLIYRRVKIGISGRRGGFRSRRNSDAATLMIMLAGANAIPAVLWWDNKPMLIAAALFFILIYLFVYRRLVTFRFAARHR
jgi:UDP-N-acetylmuramyl pentapeptide phosphotransferase/UDP-N-acetylglucosamine-1-phosphate transferase